MRKRFGLVLIALSLGLLFASRPARSDTYTFSLIPASGEIISGSLGSTVGWGYSITNDSSVNWLVTSGLNSDSFLYGTANLIFDFPDLAPDATVSVPFSPVVTSSCASPPCGLYELAWDTTAPLFFVNSGNFTLSAQWWTGDPLSGGMFFMDAPDASAHYSAMLIPEPATILLLLGGLGGVALRVRRRMGF